MAQPHLQEPQRQPEQEAPPPMAAPAPAEQQEGEAEWAGSPETAAARESVRRDAAATALDEGKLNTLEGMVQAPAPSQMIAAEAGDIAGPELIAEVAAQEKTLKREAVARAYEVVVAGGAAAAGDAKAEQAVAAAPPEMKAAAKQVAGDNSAGAPLPDETRATMEAKLGQDFSDVQIHTGDANVADLKAGAATQGTHIHFAPGQYQPGTPEGDRLIAHELTHVVQQKNAQASGKPEVAASTSPAEQQAEQVASAVAAGEQAPAVAPGSAAADAVHLGEAGVHRGIELEAAGLGQEFDPDHLDDQQRAALEMYSGNFMRDYSQLAAPMPLKILSNLPSVHRGGVTGAAGARTLMDAIVQSIAILELGPEIGRGLVTRKNIGVYEAEHHLDNPMGTSGGGDFITETAAPRPASSPEPKCIQTVDARGDAIVVDQGGTTDRETAQTHAGSAVPGLQYENPELYQVGDGGLANHLANSTEHAKDRFLDAVRLGATPEGRMNLGMGQHIVEDYFAHSNYIEVALNRYINNALATRQRGRDAAAGRSPEQAAAINNFLDGYIDADGNPQEGAALASEVGGVHGQFAFVDTLYDQTDAQGRQAITTGTFGGTDTQVSIGHVLLPKLGLVEAAFHRGVDSVFGVIDQAAATKRTPTWQTIQGMLAGKGRDGAIAQVMLEASQSAGLAVPCPDGFEVNTRRVGLPLIGSISVPTGISITTGNMAITDALITGASTYVQVMQWLDTIKHYSGYVFLDGVITAVQDKIRSAMEQLKAAVREQMTNLIRQLMVEMFNIDPKTAAHASIGELTTIAERQMHEMTDRTSMQSRMQQGGDLHGLTQGGQRGRAELERRVGPVRARDESKPEDTWGTEKNPWVTVNPLPPSHSEISKDHPPHHHEDDHEDWHDTDHSGHEHIHDAVEHELDELHDPDHEVDDDEEHEDLGEGSSFYGLHRALAVEADRHLMYQMEACWGDSLIPGQRVDEMVATNPHETIVSEAAHVAGDAADAARAAGHRHAQSDERVPEDIRNNPDVRTLLDLVDYFVSHPAASTWWHDIFDSYIAEHAAEVNQSILNRNNTRGRRKAPE